MAVALGSLLSACACTQIGCANQIRFHPAVDLAVETPYEVTACLDAVCASATLIASDPDDGAIVDRLSLWAGADEVVFDLGDGDLSGARQLTFTIQDRNGVALAEFEDTVELGSTQPNGPMCGPTCWGAEIALEAAPQEP